MAERYNCLSYAAKRMGWTSKERSDMAIDMPFDKYNYGIEKFLVMYARHIGRTTYASETLGSMSNVVTFLYTYVYGGNKYSQIDHIAVIDKQHPLKIWHRQKWYAPIEHVPIVKSGSVGPNWLIDYWKVPETDGIRGFLD